METELCELPTYEGLPNLETFLNEFEGLVMESQHFFVLDHALKATIARWWGAHKKSITNWPQRRRLMEVRFEEEVTLVNHKYSGLGNSMEHLNHCLMVFAEYPRKEWVHHFIHTLEMIPRTWYASIELRQGTQEWEGLSKKFVHTFEFADEHPTVDVVLLAIKEKIIVEIPVKEDKSH